MYNNINTLNLTQIINVLSSRHSNIPCHIIRLAVKQMFLAIQKALKSNRKIELRNFGIFSLRQRGVRLVRNPKTGQVFESPAKNKVHFKTGKKLNARINKKQN